MNRFPWIVLCVVFSYAGTVSAQDERPRVLILGDSVYTNVWRTVEQELKDRAQVTGKRVGDSSTALATFDELLGDQKWDVIHFNFGLADLHYKDPRTKTIRAMSRHAGGVRVTSPDQYEKNLDEWVTRLKARGARLVWASTTPILHPGADNLFDLRSEIEYNAIAERVMARHGVAINDMHAFVMRPIKPESPPQVFEFRGIDLHRPIVEAIEAELTQLQP